MSSTESPAGPEGEAGASRSTASARSRLFTRPWFWLLLIGTLWGLPLLKSLQAQYPDPPTGYERTAEAFELVDAEGRPVRLEDLSGFLLVVQALDLADPEGAEEAFAIFRERKSRLRGLGALVHHVQLVESGEDGRLDALIDAKTARKPANLFLHDPGGAAWARLCEGAEPTGPLYLVLDRYGRRRGTFGPSEAEGDRFARLMTLLANWEGCDPPPGEPVYK